MTGVELARAAGYRCVLDGRAADPNASLQPELRDGKHRLTWHQDARGGLVELWRRSWGEEFFLSGPRTDDRDVRQVYISETQPGVCKGFHLHPRLDDGHAQWDRFVCIRGSVMVVTFDLETWDPIVDPQGKLLSDTSGPIVERVLHGDRLERIDIPPGLAHGWLALGNEPAWVLNLTSAEYTGELEYRRPADEGPAPGVPYNWRRSRDG